MMRRIGLILGCCLAVASFGGATLAAADGPTANASRSCSPGKYPGDGYFTSLSAFGTSCTRAKEVMRAHYRCRTRNGKAGRCSSRVLNYSCTERRNSIPTEINGKVTCKKGTAKVIYTYQQNL